MIDNWLSHFKKLILFSLVLFTLIILCLYHQDHPCTKRGFLDLTKTLLKLIAKFILSLIWIWNENLRNYIFIVIRNIAYCILIIERNLSCWLDNLHDQHDRDVEHDQHDRDVEHDFLVVVSQYF